MLFHRKENALFNQLIGRSVKQIKGADKLKENKFNDLKFNFDVFCYGNAGVHGFFVKLGSEMCFLFSYK